MMIILLSVVVFLVVFGMLSVLEYTINDSEVSADVKEQRLNFERNIITIVSWGLLQAIAFFPYIYALPKLKEFFAISEANWIVPSIANLFVAPIVLNIISIILTLFFKKLENKCGHYFFCPTADESTLFYYFAGMVGTIVLVKSGDVVYGISLFGAIFATPITKYIAKVLEAKIRKENRPKNVFEKSAKFVTQSMGIALVAVVASCYAQNNIFPVLLGLIPSIILFVAFTYYGIYEKISAFFINLLSPYVDKIKWYIKRKRNVRKAARNISRRVKLARKRERKHA